MTRPAGLYFFDPEQFKAWRNANKGLSGQDLPAVKNGCLGTEEQVYGFWWVVSLVSPYSNETVQFNRIVKGYVNREIYILNAMSPGIADPGTSKKLNDFKVILNDNAQRLTVDQCFDLSEILSESNGRGLQKLRWELVNAMNNGAKAKTIRDKTDALYKYQYEQYINGLVSFDRMEQFLSEEKNVIMDIFKELIPGGNIRQGLSDNHCFMSVDAALKKNEPIFKACSIVLKSSENIKEKDITQALRGKLLTLEVAEKIIQGDEQALKSFRGRLVIPDNPESYNKTNSSQLDVYPSQNATMKQVGTSDTPVPVRTSAQVKSKQQKSRLAANGKSISMPVKTARIDGSPEKKKAYTEEELNNVFSYMKKNQHSHRYDLEEIRQAADKLEPEVVKKAAAGSDKSINWMIIECLRKDLSQYIDLVAKPGAGESGINPVSSRKKSPTVEVVTQKVTGKEQRAIIDSSIKRESREQLITPFYTSTDTSTKDVVDEIGRDREKGLVSLDQTKKSLRENGLIETDLEFDAICDAWHNSDLLRYPDFHCDYFLLLKINSMIDALYRGNHFKEIPLFHYPELAKIHRSGLLGEYRYAIESAKTWPAVIKLVKGINEYYQKTLKLPDRRLSEINLQPVAAPMHNWGQNCWANASLKFMFDLFSDYDINELKEVEYNKVGDESGKYREGLRDAFVAMREQNKRIELKQESPVSLAGYQITLMNCLYQIGRNDLINGFVLREIFYAPLPARQQDAAQLVQSLMGILGVNNNPRFSIQAQTSISAVIENREVLRLVDGKDGFQPLNIPILKKPNWMQMLIQSLSHEAITHLQETQFQYDQINELRDLTINLYRETYRADRLDQEMREGDIRRVSNDLSEYISGLLKRVVAKDAIVVNEQRILQQDCILGEGVVIKKGTTLPKPGVSTGLFPIMYNRKLVKQSKVLEAGSGEWLIMYSLGGRTSYAKGIAVVDDTGKLVKPYLYRPTYVAGKFKSDPVKTHDKDYEILSSTGVRFHDLSPEPAALVNSELARFLRSRNPDNMSPDDKQAAIRLLLPMFGLDFESAIDKEKLAPLLRPISLNDCLEKYQEKSEGEFDWDQKNLKQYAGEAYSSGKIGVGRLPGVRSSYMEANLQELRRFAVCFPMFESAPLELKRSVDALQVFMDGCFPSMSLPMVDVSTGISQNVSGDLKSLVCQSGSMRAGHYITLSFPDDGVVIVHDDRTPVRFSDYLRLKNYRNIETVEDFIENSGFTPYIALYEREAPEGPR